LPSRAGTEKDKKPAAVTVPFEMLKSGHMAVQVKVNGKGPFTLIFDTGAPISLFNTRLAKEAGLLKNMPKAGFSPFGGGGEVKVKTLEIGGAKVEDVTAIVMDHPVVEMIGDKLGKRIYGLVGFPFFARFRMTLDYQTKTMTLVPSGYKPPDIMRAMTMAILSSPKVKSLAPAAQWGIITAKEIGDEDDGVDVKSVVPASAAEKAGLRRGDRVLTLDGRWTDSLVDLFDAASLVQPDTTVTVRIKRAGKEMDLKVTPAKGL